MDAHSCALLRCHFHQALGFLSCLLPISLPSQTPPIPLPDATWGASDREDHESLDPFLRATEGEAKGEKTSDGRTEQRPLCVLLLES